ncbi:MAG: CoA transferase [SAR324 cluster bacterium]|nr:CoA transferase [SAR324 cluster bacterium]
MRPFEGIRIIDTTHVLAGPYAAYQLALLGGEVLKIENPAACDQTRQEGADPELNRRGMGTKYLAQGSNKKAMTLNLKTAAGREILKKLVVGADVFMENFRTGSFPALGLGYEELKAVNPKLIYCSLTAFGQEGPRAGQTAYEGIIQATSGLWDRLGPPKEGPDTVKATIMDYSTGLATAFAISSALFQRERTGQGQYIDVAMLDVALTIMTPFLTDFLRTGQEPRRPGGDPNFAGRACYPTKDGHLMLAAANSRQHERLFQALGRPDLAAMSDNDARELNRELHRAALSEILAERSAAEWEEFLQARHVPAARVRTLAEALGDPQFATREILCEQSDTGAVEGSFTVPGAPFKFAHGGPRVDAPPPRLGQHNEEVLRSLGFSPEDIRGLREEGVI